ncbi:MAG TPA: NADH-quinone oxidoreductase subunit L [Terriglobia bacterium]
MDILLLLMLLPPLAGAALNGIFGRRFSQSLVSWIGCGASGLAALFAILAALSSHLGPDSPPYIHSYFTWIQAGAFHTDFAVYYDRLTLVMTLTVTVIAFLIHLYSRGYMEHEGGYYRFFCYLNLFLFMMLMLVTAASYPVMFVGWEGVGLCSYLLIGFYFPKKSASDAGKKAFIVTRIGDAGFTIGVALLFWSFGSVNFGELFPKVGALALGDQQHTLTVACLLLFLGAVGKSAQLPLYVWLPDAMEGPTPVSALIHAATMVTAGVYMVARSNVLFVHAPDALKTVSAIGCLTAFFAATIALCQNDLKRMLAYSTISQLGYMFVGCGVGVFSTGIFHLMTHACFKALLFLGAGSVMHAMSGQLDMRYMGGLRHKMPVTFWTFVVATLAISGVPGLSGFFSKDAILAAAYNGPLGSPWLYWLLSPALTSFYMFRGLFLTFCGKSRVPHELEHHVHESGSKMTVPLMVLAVFSVVAGWVNVPKVMGGSDAFEHYLDPVFGASENLLRTSAAAVPHEVSEVTLMVLSLLLVGLGILVAYWFYLRSPEIPDRLATAFSGAYRTLVNKYYVDEFYNWLIVRPLYVSSDKFLWQALDTEVIDGAVNGSAEATADIGGILRRVQSGNIRSYAAWVLAGAVGWLGYLLLR